MSEVSLLAHPSAGSQAGLTAHGLAAFTVQPATFQHVRGYALVMVMVILAILSVLGVSGLQISVLAERGARNDRDYQLAWQSAESALADAEMDIHGPGVSSRRQVFSPVVDVSAFVDGCGFGGSNTGLCRLSAGKPVWLDVDFDDDGPHARTVVYGRYTGQAFGAGATGVQPVKAPRYVIELIPDPDDANAATCSSDCLYVYRVTAMGFGPRKDIHAVLQMIYRD